MKRNYQVTQLSKLGPTEIVGLDIGGPLSDAQMGEIRDLWLNAGGLLVFRDQDITPDQHVQFSARFGPLFGAPGGTPLQDTVSRYIHPDHPEIYRVSNQVDKEGQPTGRKGAGTYWHSDVSFREQPAGASVLYGKTVPKIGGDTLFANTEVAYDALSPAMKELLAPLNAVHDFAVAAATQYAKPVVVEGDMDGANRAVHPVVRTHVETGRKSLFVNPGFTSHLQGFDPAESSAVLSFLYDHMKKPDFIYRHIWAERDVVMWDNRTLMHYAVADYGDEPRYMERTTIIGERPQ